jgi:hypothetical protein
MGKIHHSAACLRIFGDDLIPEEITQMLRCQPTLAQRTGDVIRYASGRERVVRCGNWRLNATRAEPEDINDQVRSLLSKVESAPHVWKDLVRRFNVDIFCGLFMQGGNDGFSLAPDVMVLLGERGIVIDFDIYSASDDDEESTPTPT